MLGLTIFLFVIGILAFVYVIWLGFHYYHSKKELAPIVVVKRNGIEIGVKSYEKTGNITRIKTAKYEIEIKELDRPVKRGKVNGESN